MIKIKNELKKYENFLKQYVFEYSEIKEKHGSLFWNEILVVDSEGNTIAENDSFINVGYKLKGALPKLLSNLYPYEFVFKGKKVNSIESVFQGIKFPDKKSQNHVLKYSGLDSNNIKYASDYNWKQTGVIYWQGKSIVRDSDEYAHFVNELYVSTIQNPLYRQVLKSAKDKYVLHAIGEVDKQKTVLTRYEFEKQINSLVKFLNL